MFFKKKKIAQETDQELLDIHTHVEPVRIRNKFGEFDATLKTSTEVNSNYVRVDERKNKYYSKDDSYISITGQRCVDYEKVLLPFVSNYENGICPYCNGTTTMPKQKGSCKVCNQKIYVVDGYLHQGKMAIKDIDYSKLKELRYNFYNSADS